MSVERTKSPGRVRAMQERWRSESEQWVQWRKKLDILKRQPRSPDAIKKSAQAITGRSLKIEVVQAMIDRAKVRGKAYPFLARDLPTDHITKITGLKASTLRNLRRNIRKDKDNVLPPVNQEYIHRKQAVPKPRHPRTYTPAYEKGFVFAGKLAEAGLLGEATINWKRLHRVYQHYGKELPAFSVDKLRLEIFLAATIQEITEVDLSIFRTYSRIVFRETLDLLEEI